MRSSADEQRTDQLRLLVDGVLDYAIFLLDPGGHIQTWNAGARRLKGYADDEIIGKHFSIFYTEPDLARDHPAEELRIAEREGHYEEEGWRVRKDGTQFWANVVITALHDDDGNHVGFAKVTRDLSERRRTEQALRESNADLERFAAAVAHDLTEPLHTIVGLADLTARRYGDVLDDQGREYLAFVADGARRLRRLLDGLLAYSRASQRELRLKPVDVAAALGNVIEGLRARIAAVGARIEFEATALPRVMADPELLEIVLQNLVSNGLKFSEDVPRVTVSAHAVDGKWRLEVADQGIGISPRDQEQIFGLFNRLHPQDRYEGAGLGLTMCRRIVERHGGRMGVDSTPGKGSRFWFTLPAAA
jgi:PAS domain S-box-containing protein